MIKPDKKNISLADWFSLFFISPRPHSVFRIWGEMILAAVLASYPSFDLFSFLKGFFATSPLLWNAAYMINDLTDVKLDQKHPLKKNRLNLLRKMGNTRIGISIIVRIFLALLVAASINLTFTALLILLLAAQLIYTLPPLRLKERFGFDIAANGFNSIVRFFLGWTTQIVIHPFSIWPIVFLLFLKMALFIGHRMQNRKIEKENQLQSTIVILSEKNLIVLMGLFVLISSLGYMVSLIVGIFPFTSLFITVLGVVTIVLYAVSNRNNILGQEKNLTFRFWLYIDYFVVINGIALTILSQ